MKKQVLGLFAFVLGFVSLNAQTTAMQFAGQDCNGNNVDLFADLNAGKAVVLFYYMPNCGSCPPPASRIQAMANNIMNTYPGMVKGYAYPYQNSTTCAYSQSWVTNNSLNFYAPMDSGAAQVAYYGGFGMPTVVLVGGLDHRVLFVTQSFSTSDTTIMRDSILNLFATGISEFDNRVSNVSLFPNPANENLQVQMDVVQSSSMKIEVVNLLGEVVSTNYNSSPAIGPMRIDIPTANFSNGVYFVRITADNRTQQYKFAVTH